MGWIGQDANNIYLFLDSLLLKIVSEKNLDGILDMLSHLLDTSNYSKESKRYSCVHENKLGKLKDELGGKILKEYCGVRSKTYALRILDKKGLPSMKNKAKGVKRAFQKTLTLGHYKSCLEAIQNQEITQYCIKTKNHIVTTERCKKIAFSSFDSKRWLHSECKRKIHSSAFGSKWIRWAQLRKKCPYC